MAFTITYPWSAKVSYELYQVIKIQMCLLKGTHLRDTEFCPSLVIEFSYCCRDTKLMRVIKAARQIFENSIAKDCWTCVIVEPP